MGRQTSNPMSTAFARSAVPREGGLPFILLDPLRSSILEFRYSAQGKKLTFLFDPMIPPRLKSNGREGVFRVGQNLPVGSEDLEFHLPRIVGLRYSQLDDTDEGKKHSLLQSACEA